MPRQQSDSVRNHSSYLLTSESNQPEDNYLFRAHQNHQPGSQIFDHVNKNDLNNMKMGGYINKRRYKGSNMQSNAEGSSGTSKEILSPCLVQQQQTNNKSQLVSLSQIKAEQRGENEQMSMHKNNDYLQKRTQVYRKTAVGAAIQQLSSDPQNISNINMVSKFLSNPRENQTRQSSVKNERSGEVQLTSYNSSKALNRDPSSSIKIKQSSQVRNSSKNNLPIATSQKLQSLESLQQANGKRVSQVMGHMSAAYQISLNTKGERKFSRDSELPSPHLINMRESNAPRLSRQSQVVNSPGVHMYQHFTDSNIHLHNQHEIEKMQRDCHSTLVQAPPTSSIRPMESPNMRALRLHQVLDSPDKKVQRAPDIYSERKLPTNSGQVTSEKQLFGHRVIAQKYIAKVKSQLQGPNQISTQSVMQQDYLPQNIITKNNNYGDVSSGRDITKKLVNAIRHQEDIGLFSRRSDSQKQYQHHSAKNSDRTSPRGGLKSLSSNLLISQNGASIDTPPTLSHAKVVHEVKPVQPIRKSVQLDQYKQQSSSSIEAVQKQEQQVVSMDNRQKGEALRFPFAKSTKILPKINMHSPIMMQEQQDMSIETEEDENDLENDNMIRFSPSTQLPSLNVQIRCQGPPMCTVEGRNSETFTGVRYSQVQPKNQPLTVQNNPKNGGGVQLIQTEKKKVRAKKMSMGPLTAKKIKGLPKTRQDSGSPRPFHVHESELKSMVVDSNKFDNDSYPFMPQPAQARITPSFIPNKNNSMPIDQRSEIQQQPQISFQTVQLNVNLPSAEPKEQEVHSKEPRSSKVTTAHSKRPSFNHKKASKSHSKRADMPQNVGDGLFNENEQHVEESAKLTQVKSLKNLEPQMKQFLHLFKGQDESSEKKIKANQLTAQELGELVERKKQIQAAIQEAMQNPKYKVLGGSLPSSTPAKVNTVGGRFSQGPKKAQGGVQQQQMRAETSSVINRRNSQTSSLHKTCEQQNTRAVRVDQMTRALKERDVVPVTTSQGGQNPKALVKQPSVQSHIISPRNQNLKKVTTHQQEQVQKRAASRKQLISGKKKMPKPGSGQKSQFKNSGDVQTNYRSSLVNNGSQEQPSRKQSTVRNQQAQQSQVVSISVFDLQAQPNAVFLGQKGIQNVEEVRQRSSKALQRPQQVRKTPNNMVLKNNSKQSIMKPQSAIAVCDLQQQRSELDLIKVYGQNKRNQGQVSIENLIDESSISRIDDVMGKVYIKVGVGSGGTGSSVEHQGIVGIAVPGLNNQVMRRLENNARMGPISSERSGEVTLREDHSSQKTKTQDTFQATIDHLLITEESINIAGNASLRASYTAFKSSQGARKRLQQQTSEGEQTMKRKTNKKSKSPRPKKSTSQQLLIEVRNNEASPEELDSALIEKKKPQLINLCIEKKLQSNEINQELLDSEKMKEFEAMTIRACKNAYSLPSEGEKSSTETYRQVFRRRHTVERTNLIVVRASDLVIATGFDFPTGSQERHQKVMIRSDILSLIAQLLPTNQVAILLDFEDQKLAAWVTHLLLKKVKMQVDAIYSFKGRMNPSTLIIDITQIINDFRLFSGYQINYKRSLPNQSLFTFVEASHKNVPHCRLLLNGAMCYNYTHVSIGILDEENEYFEALLAYLVTQQVPQKVTFITEQTVQVNGQQLEMEDCAKLSQQIHMAKRGLAHLNGVSEEEGGLSEREEFSNQIAEMRQRNGHIARSRAIYGNKFALSIQKRKLMNREVLAYGGRNGLNEDIDPCDSNTHETSFDGYYDRYETLETNQDSPEKIHYQHLHTELTVESATPPVELARLKPRQKSFQLAMVGNESTPEHTVAKFEWLATRVTSFTSKGDDVKQWMCEDQVQAKLWLQSQLALQQDETNNNGDILFTDQYQSNLQNVESKREQFRRIMDEAGFLKQPFMTPTRKPYIS